MLREISQKKLHNELTFRWPKKVNGNVLLDLFTFDLNMDVYSCKIYALLVLQKRNNNNFPHGYKYFFIRQHLEN